MLHYADTVVGASSRLACEGFYISNLYTPNSKKPVCITATGFSYLALAMFYFHMGNPHYHRRCFVSLLSSAWGQVGPKRYSHQEILFINEVSLINVNPEKAIKFFCLL